MRSLIELKVDNCVIKKIKEVSIFIRTRNYILSILVAFGTLSLLLSPLFGAGPDMHMAPSTPTTPASSSTGAIPLSPSTAASDTTKAT